MQGARADARRNRQRILAAAREVFAAEGPGARMDIIAAQAGLAVGTLYRHFPTKEALLEAAVADRTGEAEAEARAALARAEAGADAGAEVDALVRRFAQEHRQDRAWKAAAAAVGVVPAFDRGDAAAALDAVGRLLRRAQEAGQIRAGVTAVDLWLLLAGLPGPEAPPDSYQRCLDVVLAGLRPAAAG